MAVRCKACGEGVHFGGHVSCPVVKARDLPGIFKQSELSLDVLIPPMAL